jgi:hypothetical protein
MSERPTDAELARAHRAFAVEYNNRAWTLTEKPDRTDADNDELLHLAHAAALHWRYAGNALNTARAQMLLGHVHASLGHGDLALRYARASHAYLTSIDSPDWEIAFSHAVLAHAHAAAHHAHDHREQYALARRAGDAIADPEDRAVFEATFRTIPPP